MNILLEHAENELKLAGYYDGNEINTLMRDCVLELVEVFSNQEHSGMSAPWCISLFKQLAAYKIITPLTGAEDEWQTISDYGLTDGTIKTYQNKRLSTVFKEVSGDGDNQRTVYYDIDGYILRDPKGCYYGSGKFTKQILEFPYTPTTEYIDTNEEGDPIGDVSKYTFLDRSAPL